MDFLVNGKRASAMARGEIGSGLPVLVMVHGVGLTHRFWQPMFENARLRSFGLIAFDLPGHGDSDGPMPMTIEENADWLVAAMDSAGVRRPVLAGHSMGGLIAMEAARRIESSGNAALQRLVVLGSAARLPVNPDLLTLARETPAKAAALVAKWGFADGDAHAAARDEIEAIQANSAPGVLHRGLAACNDYTGGEETARAIGAPTTVIAGAEDKMVRASASRALAELFADGQYEELPNAGHMMVQEATDAVAAILAGALEG